jgi:putative transcriptional regulator
MSDNSSNNYLENQFLIAMPQLAGSYFANSLTYLWKHNEDGALGIVINKPLQASVADIFDELDIVCDIDKNLVRQKKLLAGGPVEQDKGFIIHDSDNRWESSITITSQITICTSKTILNDIAGGAGPKNYLVALGCAGWDSGQLEEEISANTWITVPANAELIFSNNYSSKIDEAAALLGINLLQISPETGHS